MNWEDLKAKYPEGAGIGIAVDATEDGPRLSVLDAQTGITLLHITLEPQWAYDLARNITEQTIKVEEYRKGRGSL